MKTSAHNLDVLVIGGGVTGASALRHLVAHGVNRLGLASAGRGGEASLASPGLIMGGQADNFTRVSHAHGRGFAAELWQFGDRAFDALAAFCDEAGVRLQRQRFLRLVTSPHELTEARRAIEELTEAGLSKSGDLTEAPALGSYGSAVTERVLAIQDDGPRGGYVDPVALLAGLRRDPRWELLPAAVSITPTPAAIETRLANGELVRSQMVVCAAHLATGDLVPSLRDALVGVADQWCEVEADLSAYPGWRDGGIVFGANHTYEWGVILDERHLRLGGGRYLRPMAGIEARAPVADERITRHLAGQLAKTFRFGGGARVGRVTPFVDCRPCDELPVIGPMFGEGRILVAAGYMGTGLTLGFLAGRCLADLIVAGQSTELPRRLWPERLRSMPS